MIKKKTPLDVKLVSLFLLWTAFIYFEVNKNMFPFYGFLIYGNIANILWVINSIFYIVCAIGFYKTNYIVWKILTGYSVIELGNFFINNFFIPNDKIISIMTNEILSDYRLPESNFFFYLLLLFQVFFILYLFKRKRLFKKEGKEPANIRGDVPGRS